MISLPDGFDYNLLLSDFWFLSVPFVFLSVLFVAYRFYLKATSSI